MSRTVDELDAERIADDLEIASWEDESTTTPRVILAEAIEEVLAKIEKEDTEKEAAKDDLDPTADSLEIDYQEALNVLSDVRLLLEELIEPKYNWRLPDFIRKNIKTTLEEVETYLDSVDEGEETEL